MSEDSRLFLVLHHFQQLKTDRPTAYEDVLVREAEILADHQLRFVA